MMKIGQNLQKDFHVNHSLGAGQGVLDLRISKGMLWNLVKKLWTPPSPPYQIRKLMPNAEGTGPDVTRGRQQLYICYSMSLTNTEPSTLTTHIITEPTPNRSIQKTPIVRQAQC
jgi:hypothetical protein